MGPQQALPQTSHARHLQNRVSLGSNKKRKYPDMSYSDKSSDKILRGVCLGLLEVYYLILVACACANVYLLCSSFLFRANYMWLLLNEALGADWIFDSFALLGTVADFFIAQAMISVTWGS